MIRVNSIVIPARFVAICGRWHDNCMLYEIYAGHGIHTDSFPMPEKLDFANPNDCNEKWYLTLWRDFAGDIDSAVRSAYVGNDGEVAELEDMGRWARDVCMVLARSYGLTGWCV